MENPWDSQENNPKKIAWYYSPWFVLFMILFVLGPFALPLLYKSPRFSRGWKIFWTLFVLAIGYLTVVGTIKTYQALKPIYESFLKAQAS